MMDIEVHLFALYDFNGEYWTAVILNIKSLLYREWGELAL